MRKLFVWLSYFLIAFLLFYNGHQGMIVTDANGWFITYQKMGWHGLIHSFGDKSLHYFYHLFFFIGYKLFGFHTAYWAGLFIALHALAATTGFIFFKKIYEALNLSFATITAYAGSLLFLLNAYNAEPVIWVACIHYPLCITFNLAALIYMIEYAMHGKASSAWMFVFFFVVALFLLELSLALPLICIPLLLVFRHRDFSKQKLLLLQAVSVFIILLYLVMNKIRVGSIVGHYGAATHLNTDPVLIASNLDKYFAKYFVFSQFWHFEPMSKLYALFETPYFAYGTIAFFVLISFLFICFRRHFSTRMQTAFLLLACSVMALAPVINLYFTSIVHNECDRLGYFFAVFLSQSISLFAFSFLLYGCAVILIYLALNTWFLNKNVSDWKKAGTIEQRLISMYRWENTPEVIILNMPDNFEGAYLFRTEFKNTLLARGVHTDSIVEVLKYNMNSITDSVVVEKISDHSLKVSFRQWGNWWWANGKGADSYTTTAYDVKIDEWSHSYIVHFKTKNPATVYLYQCGTEWREFKF